MATSAVHVDGLKELVRDARKVDRDLPKQMRRDLLPISRDVLQGARTRAETLGGVHRHAVRRGLRGGATQNTAWIRLMASTEPTIMGAEFGGGRRRTTRQFPPWRGAGRTAGYFVYPTLREESDDIMRRVEDSVRDLMRRAGFT